MSRSTRSTECYGPPVAEEISQRELRNSSGEILRRVDAGETFVITRNGVPVAELGPLRRRHFVPMEEVLEAFRGMPHIDYERFRADLDAFADPDWRPRE